MLTTKYLGSMQNTSCLHLGIKIEALVMGGLYARQNFLVRSINYVINQSSDKHITPKEIKWVTVAERGAAEGSTETQANKQCTLI